MRNWNIFKEEPIRIAELHDGSRVYYDACGSTNYTPNHSGYMKNFKFIGVGRIYSIDGIKQEYKQPLTGFWIRK